MNVRGFGKAIGQDWAIVVSALLLGVLAAMGVILFTTPKFVATSRVFLATPGWNGSVAAGSDRPSPYQGDDFSRQRAMSYARLVANRDLAQRVVDKLGEHMPAAELAEATTAHVLPDTVVIDISVRDSSAVRAERLADGVTAEFCTEIRNLEMPSGSLIPTVEPVVTQVANLPRHPAEPATGIDLVLGATAGLLLGLTIAVARQARSRLLGRGDPVAEIARRPVLGFVPLLGAQRAAGDLERLGRAADQVRALRAALAVGCSNVPHDVLVVTSPGPREEHHTVARALALALAESGRRTALVDADLRRGSGTGETGLTAVVAGRIALADALDPDSLLDVEVLNSGAAPANPSPLLQSWRMRTTMAELRSAFEAVVVVAAPALAYEDCRTLAALADGVLVVAAEGRTHTTDLEATVRGLEVLDVPVLGVVVNYAAEAAPRGAARGGQTLQERSS